MTSGARPLGDAARGTGPSLPRYAIVVASTPWLVCAGFAALAHISGDRGVAGSLLPFDAPAAYGDAASASLMVALVLCGCRAAGMTRWMAYVGIGMVAGVVEAALWCRSLMLPLWCASAIVNGSASVVAWLLVRDGRRNARAAGRGSAIAGGVAILLPTVLLVWAMSRDVRHLTFLVLPTADGGRLSEYAWFSPGFVDSTFENRIYYTPPGLWSRVEPVFTPLWEDRLDHPQRVEFHHRDDRKAVSMWTKRGGLAAKRVMVDPQWWKGPSNPPRPKRPRWEGPILDFPCIARGFAAPGSRSDEVLVPVGSTVSHPDRRSSQERFVDLRNGIRDCGRDGTWRPDRIDLQADQFRETALDLPANALRTIAYSSRTYDDAWRLDLEATLTANPEAHPLPLPEVVATVTVIRFPTSYKNLSADQRFETLREVPGAQVVCTARERLRPFEPTELICNEPMVAAPSRFEVTGLWGDPNPELVALFATEPGGRRYLLVPLGWNIGAGAFFGGSPTETTFLRVERLSEVPAS